MNERMKSTKATAILMTVLVIGFGMLFSCANPAGLGLPQDLQDPYTAADAGDDTPPAPPAAPPSGVQSDPETGLSTGLNFDVDFLENDPVEIVGDIEWVPGVTGDALATDTDGEFLRIPDGTIPEIGSAGTVEAWVTFDSYVTFAGILHKGHLIDFSDEAWTLQLWSGNKPMMRIYNDAGAYKQVVAPAALSLDDWHYLAVTWDDTDMIFYVDGVEVNRVSTVGFGAVKDTDGDLLIGSQLSSQYNATYGHLTHDGIIDEVAIYDVVRTPEEIAASWTALAPSP